MTEKSANTDNAYTPQNFRFKEMKIQEKEISIFPPKTDEHENAI